MAAPELNLQTIQSTTNPAGLWLIVNGPVADRLGINSGPSCLGPGSWANATMGRALRLIQQNIGGALPGVMDRATHGYPGKYTFCCAENEKLTPREPLHVERGYARHASTVTLVGALGTLNLNTHSKNADDVLRVFADSMAYPAVIDYIYGGEPWLILSPEHADILKRAGYTKSEVKRRLWEQSKLSASRLADRDLGRAQNARRAELGEITRETLGQQVVVDNRPGASSIIGTEMAVRATPDGYTLYIASNTHTLNPSLVREKLPYDTVRDLAPVSLVGSTPLILVVHPKFPVATVKELVALARQKPAQLHYASTGAGTPQNLAGALLGYMTGVKLVSVPYKGVAQAMTDLLSGDLQLSFPSITSVQQHVKAGSLRALATTGLTRAPLAPALPTISESGVTGYETSLWTGILVPAATPRTIIARLNAEIVGILKSEDARERYTAMGVVLTPSSAQELGAFIPREMQKWAALVKGAGIQPE